MIKVTALAHGRLRAPDLDRMEEFLTDFGMIRLERTSDALYMRGTDARPHIHVTEKGDPGFIGCAFHAAAEADLDALSRLPGASAVESVDEPGGGKRVRLREPNGYRVDVLHGAESPAEIPVHRDPMNSGAEPLRRAGKPLEIAKSPAPVKRIGHCVLATPNVVETVQWFRDTLGLIRSDDVYAGDKSNIIGSFNRIDAGDAFTDHHALFCIRNEKAGLNHLSFETPDADAVFQDHEYLKGLGKYDHMWGIGRHLLGSQIFDYWCDPWGRVHERWADTDRLNAKNGGNLVDADVALGNYWGPEIPDRFIAHASP